MALSFGAMAIVVVCSVTSSMTTMPEMSITVDNSVVPLRYYEPLPEHLMPCPVLFERVACGNMFSAAVSTCTVDLQTSKFCVTPGPKPDAVTPGRSSAPRDSVPSRSRRKLRVWERDELA